MAFGFFSSCNDSENDLLKKKVYFENENINLEIEEQDEYTFDLLSRITLPQSSAVNIGYELGQEDLVKLYNEKNGTNYILFPSENVKLESENVEIKPNKVYAEPCAVSLEGLKNLKEGVTYLLPIELKRASISAVPASDKVFVVVKKPVVINKVYQFERQYLSVPMPTDDFGAITYEALIYADRFTWISTIMGVEGNLMLRFGDTTIKDNQMQIAGGVQYNAPLEFATGKWYHVAFTFDGTTGRTMIYINGEKVADKQTDKKSFNLAKDFFIGYAYDYDARRKWHGKMSECRVWSVARTANDIKQNMLQVDPNTEGLICYYKLNGKDIVEKDGKYYVLDQSPNHINAISRKGRYSGGKGKSVKPIVVDLKVDLK